MNPIELTEEHKSKLLEMCKTLFPEYSCHNFWGSNFIGMYNRDEDGEEIEENNISIHWFEFLVCYLVGAIQEALPEELVWSECPPYVGNIYGWKEGHKWTLYSRFMFHYPKAIFGGTDLPHNPIDYLYTEFQNIKK